MEKILEMLQAILEEQKEQKAFREEMREFQGEMYEFRDQMSEFRKEANERFEEVNKRFEEANERFGTLEKLAIQNGEKLDNNRDHVNKKINFIEHKQLQLEQRIFELESRYERQ